MASVDVEPLPPTITKTARLCGIDLCLCLTLSAADVTSITCSPLPVGHDGLLPDDVENPVVMATSRWTRQLRTCFIFLIVMIYMLYIYYRKV